MTNISGELFERARKVMPKGVNSPVRFYEPYPFFAVSGNGSRIITADHCTLVDFCMGYGALLLGHSNADVVNLVKNQLDNGSLFCIPTENEVVLAELLSGIVPGCEVIRLVNTGSEATMHAIRLARAFTGKSKVIKFDGCYHGAHDYVLVSSGSGAAASTSSDGSLKDISSQTLVATYNDISSLENLIDKNNDIACVIVEPVMANMGLVLPEKNFLNDLRKITYQKDIVLIFDEVITGFRLALGGAAEFFAIQPDISTYAKALGNGFPIAAITGRREIMSNLTPEGKVYQASTYAGNPVSTTAAIAVMNTLQKMKNEIYPRIGRTCDTLVGGLRDQIEDNNLPCNVNNIGSMFQLFFTPDKVRDARTARKSNINLFNIYFNALLSRDIFVPPSQFETCFTSHSHNEDDVDKSIEAFGDSLLAVKKEIANH